MENKNITIDKNITESITTVQKYASELVITDHDVACEVGNHLFHLSELKKKLEDQRTEFTKPINLSLKNINAFFKKFSVPLEEADRELRTKLATYAKTADTIAFGVAHVKSKKVITITDPTKVPKKYLSPDMNKITAAIKAGEHIEGVIVEEDKIVSL